jgi:GTP-binding protein
MPAALDDAKYLLSETSPEGLGAAEAEVTFVGRSNVGKSSLINALCRREIARVSGTPGRTRAINVYAAAPGRWLVDLPGYGYAEGGQAERAGWGRMIEGYLRRRPNLRRVFVLVDAKVGPTRLDLDMLRWLQSQGLPWRVVATKADQVKPSGAPARRRAAAQALGILPENLAWVSAAENLGVKELRREIEGLLQSDAA